MSITREIESGIESLLFWGAFGGALSETIGGSLGGAINELARWLLRHELAEWYINGDGVAHRMLRGLVTGTVTGGVCGAMGGTISGAICCRKVNECEPDEYIIGSGIAGGIIGVILGAIVGFISGALDPDSSGAVGKAAGRSSGRTAFVVVLVFAWEWVSTVDIACHAYLIVTIFADTNV